MIIKTKNNTKVSIYAVIVSLYFFSLPMNTLGLGDFGSLLRYIGIVVFFAWLLFSRKIKMDILTISAIIFFLTNLLSLLISIDLNQTFLRVIAEGFFLLLLISISELEYNDKNSNLIIKSGIWASRLTAIIFFISADYYENTGRISLGGIFVEDPNYLTAYFLFGYIFALFNLNKNEKISNKIIAIVEIIAYIFIILSTGSRTGFITYIIISIIFAIFRSKNNPRVIIKILLVLSLSSTFMLIISKYISADILNRFSLDSILSSGGTGRYQIWEDALTIFYNSNFIRILFGYGSGTIIDVYTNNGYLNAVAHNIFIEKLIENGIIGFSIYVYFIGLIVWHSWKLKNKEFFFILLAMIIMSFASSLSIFKPYWNIILMIVYFSKQIELENDISMIKSA